MPKTSSSTLEEEKNWANTLKPGQQLRVLETIPCMLLGKVKLLPIYHGIYHKNHLSWLCNDKQKYPAHGRHWISRRVLLVAPIPLKSKNN